MIELNKSIPKLSHKCPICNKYIFLNEDTAVKDSIFYHLNCYVNRIIEFRGKSK